MTDEAVMRLLNIAVHLVQLAAIFSLPVRMDRSGRWLARGHTFFSVRVEPCFPGSDPGRAIMKTFRLRIWIWTSLVALVFACIPSTIVASSIGFFSAMLLTWMGNYFSFSQANQSVRAIAEPVSPSVLRRATLEAEDRGTMVLELIEWSGMLLPIALPVATAIVMKLNGRTSLMPAFYFALGFLPAQIQYALRFGARGSDWAADPARSRRYRAYLGLVNTVGFGFIILSGCVVVLFPIYYYFWFVFPGMALVYIAQRRVLAWLKRNLSESSCDPMPDACWKWGQYYFNPDDPALVVPSRTGISYSPNFARRSIWMVWAVLHAASIPFLWYSFHQIRHWI